MDINGPPALIDLSRYGRGVVTLGPHRYVWCGSRMAVIVTDISSYR